MNTQRLTSTYYDLTHGWHGFFVLYLLIAIFSLLGLKRGQAGIRQYVFSPITSLLTLLPLGLLMEIVSWILSKLLNLPLGGVYEDLFNVIFVMFGGFVGGIYWAELDQPLRPIRQVWKSSPGDVARR